MRGRTRPGRDRVDCYHPKEVPTLSVNLAGAESLLDLLRRMAAGHAPTDAELGDVLDANAYCFGFYAGWEGVGRETLREALRHFRQPERVPAGTIPTCMAEGFRRAVAEMDLMDARLAWLREIDPSGIAERVLAYLPGGTPLDSTVHITIDAFNNAFAHAGAMGVSLLKGAADRRSFEDAVGHELHHLGVAHWAARDARRQALLRERSGRAVAVRHVGNLLSEGLANYYLTPHYVFLASPDEPPAGPYRSRLERLARDEGAYMARAEAILAQCLERSAAYEACLAAYEGVALDMEEHMLPAGHYLGARMVATMARVHPSDAIVACVQHLPAFLPLYNEAAAATGALAFGPHHVARFGRLWAPDAMP